MFKTKKIFTSLNLGEMLGRAREERGFSLKEIEKATQIPVKYILALEQGTYEFLPSELYLKNYIRSYSRFLGLNENKLIDQYEKEWIIYQKNFAEKNNKRPPRIIINPKLIKKALTVLFLSALIIFLFIILDKITKPPILIVDFPPEKFQTDQNYVEIRGSSEREATIIVNDQEIYPDSQGNFKKTLDLNSGLNIIKIQAKKKRSDFNTIYREVIVE